MMNKSNHTTTNRAATFAKGVWRRLRGAVSEAGMTTAEYAVGTLAACAFAAILYKVVQSGAVQDGLASLIQAALGTIS